jgi:hypothetical protein
MSHQLSFFSKNSALLPLRDMRKIKLSQNADLIVKKYFFIIKNQRKLKTADELII